MVRLTEQRTDHLTVRLTEQQTDHPTVRQTEHLTEHLTEQQTTMGLRLQLPQLRRPRLQQLRLRRRRPLLQHRPRLQHQPRRLLQQAGLNELDLNLGPDF